MLQLKLKFFIIFAHISHSPFPQSILSIGGVWVVIRRLNYNHNVIGSVIITAINVKINVYRCRLENLFIYLFVLRNMASQSSYVSVCVNMSI